MDIDKYNELKASVEKTRRELKPAPVLPVKPRRPSRLPCRGGCGRMIVIQPPKGTARRGRKAFCRKCARKNDRIIAKAAKKAAKVVQK